MRTYRYLLVLVFLISGTATIHAKDKEIPVTTSSRDALKFFKEGRDKLDNAEFVAAASLFDKAIQADPGFARAYLYRAQSGGGYGIFRENLDKAVSLIEQVSAGEKLEILYIQAYAAGEGRKAKENLDQLLTLFPEDKRVQISAGQYYFNNNDFPNALKHILKAGELDNNFAAAYNMLGYCQSASDNLKEAEKAFQKYIELVPYKGNPYDSYAELLLKMGKYDQSIAEYKIAIAKDPVNFAGSLLGIGNNYIFKGDYVSARKSYQDYFDKAPSAEAKLGSLFLKAISYIHEGIIESAIKTLDEYRLLAEKENMVTNEIVSYVYQGYVYSESGKPSEGIKMCNKASDLVMKSNLAVSDRDNMMTTVTRWHIYSLVSNNELDKAAQELVKYRQKVESRKNPGELMSINSLYGFFELRKGNNDKALEYFSKGNRESPWDWYYSGMANKKGNSQNAFKLFNKITGCNVNSIDLALVIKRAGKELRR